MYIIQFFGIPDPLEQLSDTLFTSGEYCAGHLGARCIKIYTHINKNTQ